jgi:hypothetical protein
MGGGLSDPKPLRFVLTDADQPPLLDIPLSAAGRISGGFLAETVESTVLSGCDGTAASG